MLDEDVVQLKAQVAIVTVANGARHSFEGIVGGTVAEIVGGAVAVTVIPDFILRGISIKARFILDSMPMEAGFLPDEAWRWHRIRLFGAWSSFLGGPGSAHVGKRAAWLRHGVLNTRTRRFAIGEEMGGLQAERTRNTWLLLC